MAMDGVNITEDTEMADCEADKVVTMVDVLQEQQDFEEDANAVLGASDANNCTYSQGYIKRQAIYACLTCCPESKTDPKKRAGVCLACSLNCHENHELIELYTKRNFRCDCGNPKFNSNPCQFITNKDDFNPNNVYNHNFSGLYCTCMRPYPDPEATVDDDMIQCIICEDWLHASHINAVVPPNDQYSEMICKACMDRNEFLHDYSSLAVNCESIEVDVITVNGEKNPFPCNGDEAVENNEDKINGLSNGVDVDMENETKANPKNEGNKEANNPQAIEVTSIESITKDDEKETETIEENCLSTTNSTGTESISSMPEKKADIESEDKITNADDATSNQEMPTDPGIETQEEKKTTVDETIDKNSNTDNDKSLENIGDITSKEAIEVSKDEETTSQNSAKESQDDKTPISLEKETGSIISNNVIDENKDPMTIENSINKDAENNSLEVTSTQKENVDKDCSDAVMDAINELLDGPKDANNKSEGNIEQVSNESTVSTDVPQVTDTETSQGHNETETPSVINNEKLDVEMANNEALKERMDTIDSEKEDQTTTDDSCAKTDTDTEMANNNSINDTLVESEKNDPTTADGNNTIITDTETTKDTSIDDKIETILDFEKKDPITADDSTDKTNNDVDMTNNKSIEKLDTSVESVNEKSDKNEEVPINDKPAAADVNDLSNTNITNSTTEIQNESANTNENKRKLSIDLTDETSKKAKLDFDKCIRPKGVKKVFKGATFWPPNFRQQLCTCGECISMYKDLQVLFLIDLEDTVSYYEGLGKQKVDSGGSQYERGLEALSSLDRMQQINALTEYNNMRDRLLDFLKSFKDRQEVVKEEDIRAFFAGMKPRREPDGVYFCR